MDTNVKQRNLINTKQKLKMRKPHTKFHYAKENQTIRNK